MTADRGQFRLFAAVLVLAACAISAGCGSPLVEPGSSSRYPGARRPGEPVAIGNPATRSNSAGVAIPPDLQGIPRVPASSAVTISPKSAEAVYHEVARGETPASIARRFGTTTERLLKLNGLEPTAVLRPGQLLAIPQ